MIPGLAVTDTIKRVDEAGRVVDTLDRARLRAVQTPQLFAVDLLRRAHRDGPPGATDDARLVEQAGEEVLVVDGDPGNLKVTRPGDLDLLTAWAGRGAAP